MTRPGPRCPDTLTAEFWSRDHQRCGGYTDDLDLCDCQCHDDAADEYLRSQR